MPDWKQIQVKQGKGWVTFVLNRPHVHNALNQALIKELGEALTWLEKQDSVRVLIITGAGEKAFSAGADIHEFARFSSGEEIKAWTDRVQRLFTRIETLPIPVVMVVNGYALGGGCELALTGDLILAADQAVFGQPEVGLGIIPGYGGTQRLARIIGKPMTKYLCMTGEKISAMEAYRLGIVQKVIATDQLREESEKLAAKLVNQAPLAIRYIKQAINEGVELQLDAGLEIESTYFARAFETKDCEEGISAFLAKRKPFFAGE